MEKGRHRYIVDHTDWLKSTTRKSLLVFDEATRNFMCVSLSYLIKIGRGCLYSRDVDVFCKSPASQT